MSAPVTVSYLGVGPRLGGAACERGAAVIGRARLAAGVELGRYATLRADGHDIMVGADCRFLDRATVHISDGLFPAIIGAHVTVGRYALIHACRIGEGCVIGDAAVVMDDARLGPGAVLAAGALVPPGKKLEGGRLYDGNPARPLRAIDGDREQLRRALIEGGGRAPVCGRGLPPLDMAPYVPPGGGAGPLYPLGGARPEIDARSYVAPTAVVAGEVVTAPGTSVWFATVMHGDGAAITLGPRSNVQDNSILVTDSARGPITIGADVTVGHNVRMGACRVDDEALIGMGAEVGDGVVVEPGALIAARALVEPGTVVKAGHIWAGRPAREFRPVKPEEQAFFRRGKDVYVGYTDNYLAQAAA